MIELLQSYTLSAIIVGLKLYDCYIYQNVLTFSFLLFVWVRI